MGGKRAEVSGPPQAPCLQAGHFAFRPAILPSGRPSCLRAGRPAPGGPSGLVRLERVLFLEYPRSRLEMGMSASGVLGFINAFGAGLLAGEEFVIRYGVRGPLGRLDQEPHIRMRQGLIRTLRILVPAILLPTLVSAVAVTVVDGA